jgi:poly-gamma-glutamate synthesis protein (capsule biosynthesis protein)
MKADGAEATMLYIHWGNEYQLQQNTQQSQMAQKICDLGVDVIVGGHPHVVQPMDLLESTVDPDHKTVCLYSMGNAVSNQRLGNISYVSTAHTEDGVLFSVTFEKYSDGTVYLQDVDILPTWVYMSVAAYPNTYHIIPLDIEIKDQWVEQFGISETVAASAMKSYARTMAIVGNGLTASQEYLAQEKADREQYYYDLVFNPEKLEVQETTAPTEETVAATDAA